MPYYRLTVFKMSFYRASVLTSQWHHIPAFLCKMWQWLKWGAARGLSPTSSGFATPAAIWTQPGQKLWWSTWIQNHWSWRSEWQVNSVLWTKIGDLKPQNKLKPTSSGLCPGPRWGAYSELKTPNWWEGIAAPPRTDPRCCLFGPRVSALAWESSPANAYHFNRWNVARDNERDITGVIINNDCDFWLLRPRTHLRFFSRSFITRQYRRV